MCVCVCPYHGSRAAAPPHSWLESDQPGQSADGPIRSLFVCQASLNWIWAGRQSLAERILTNTFHVYKNLEEN